MVSPQNPFHDILMFAFLLFVIPPLSPPLPFIKIKTTEFVSGVQMLLSCLVVFPIHLIVTVIFPSSKVKFQM